MVIIAIGDYDKNDSFNDGLSIDIDGCDSVGDDGGDSGGDGGGDCEEINITLTIRLSYCLPL